MSDDLEPVELDDVVVERLTNPRKAPVIVDIKSGPERIEFRFSAAHERNEKSGALEFELWYWAGGRVTAQQDGKVGTIEDVMNGTTRLRVESSCPETIAMLILESWLINHERDWALAFTDGTRDLSGRELRPDDGLIPVESPGSAELGLEG